MYHFLWTFYKITWDHNSTPPRCRSTKLRGFFLELLYFYHSSNATINHHSSKIANCLICIVVSHSSFWSTVLCRPYVNDGNVTMTIEVSMDFSGYAGHATILVECSLIACCLVVALGLGLGLRLDLASRWFVVMHTYLNYFRLSSSTCRQRRTVRASRRVASVIYRLPRWAS